MTGVLLILLGILIPLDGYALEWSLEGGIGPSFYQKTVEDGIWYQEAFPHKFYTQSIAWKVGVGVRVDTHWSFHVAYLNLGQVQADTLFVWDGDYDPKAHKCLKHCEKPHHLSTVDKLQGGELMVGYHYPLGGFDPFVKVGMALMSHTLEAQCTTSLGESCSGVDRGIIPMVGMGGGVCYALICGEVMYYRGIAETGTPIATDALVPMVTVRLPF